MLSFNPVAELNALRREIERAFDTASAGSGLRNAFLPARNPRLYPAVNVAEDGDNVHVEALAPGLDSQSIQITVQRNQLTIAGEKVPVADTVTAESYHRQERSTGRFVRTLTLPAEVDENKVTAEYAAGILRITLPKAEAARPRRIAVTLS